MCELWRFVFCLVQTMPWLVARVDGIMVLGTHFWEILGDARVKGINHDESIYEYIYIRSYTHIYIYMNISNCYLQESNRNPSLRNRRSTLTTSGMLPNDTCPWNLQPPKPGKKNTTSLATLTGNCVLPRGTTYGHLVVLAWSLISNDIMWVKQ